MHTDKTNKNGAFEQYCVLGGNEGDKISSLNGILHNRRMRNKLNWLVKFARLCVLFLVAFEQGTEGG